MASVNKSWASDNKTCDWDNRQDFKNRAGDICQRINQLLGIKIVFMTIIRTSFFTRFDLKI